MGTEAGRGALGVDAGIAGDRPAGLARHGGDIGQGQRIELAGIVAGGFRMAILPGHGIDRDVPDFCRPLTQDPDDLLRRLDGRLAVREAGSAAAGQEGVTEGAGIADDGTYLVVVDAQLFGRHLRDRRARAADVRRAGH